MASDPRPPVEALIDSLREARQRTLELLADLNDEQVMGPRLAIVNPLRWEVGHVGWFQEFWLLRHLSGLRPLLAGEDELYNSATVPHDTRWDLPLPPMLGTYDYVQRVLDRVGEEHEAGRLQSRVAADGYDAAYFLTLALFHECMHAEAMTYTRQTLGYGCPDISVASRAPPLPNPPPRGGREWPPPQPSPARGGRGGEALAREMQALGDAYVPGGAIYLGTPPGAPFVFDNEQWAHPVDVARFAIARAAVTNGQFAEFVADDGYRRRELWTEAGWGWRERVDAEHPVYWQSTGGNSWLRRYFDRMMPLEPDLPMLHVNWYEASAYCRWSGRRLPTEAEWEMAAAAEPTPDGRCITARKRRYPWGDAPPTPERANLDWHAMGCVSVHALPAGDSPFGCRQMLGNTWEWTSSTFGPYPGFSPGPYKEYSQPWFGDHQVLRGGCWATRSGLITNSYRNFYLPDRRDVWAGFRTCAA